MEIQMTTIKQVLNDLLTQTLRLRYVAGEKATLRPRGEML